jgi:hypothetical protein
MWDVRHNGRMIDDILLVVSAGRIAFSLHALRSVAFLG